MERPRRHRLLHHLRSPRVLRFAAVGFSGVFVNLGMLYALADVIGIRDVLSSAIAIEASIIWNFLLNNAWTFRDKNVQARVGFSTRLFRYNVVSLVGLAIQLATFIVLTTTFISLFHLPEAGIWKYPSQLVGIAIAMAWNFVSNFFWTWAQEDTSPGPADAEPGPASSPKELEQP